MLRQCGIFLTFALFALAAAAIEIPKASGKALGVTKGKPFTAGYVFVNGHFLNAPYVVERWGVGIRINGIPVIGEEIAWNEFLKTQEGVKMTKSETAAPSEPEPEPEPEPEVEEESDDGDSLDDLFDDDPKPKKAKKTAKKKPVRRARPKKPAVTVSYSLSGDFVMNDAAKAMVAKINRTRTDINATLIKGGLICFGDQYPRVTGDPRTAENFMDNIPELLKQSNSFEAFIAGAKSAHLLYLSETICEDLYKNRRDYLTLMQRREKDKKEREWKKLLNGMDN